MKAPSIISSHGDTFTLGNPVRLRYAQSDAGVIVGILYRSGGTVSLFVNWPDEADVKEQFPEELKHDEGFEA